MGYLEIMKNHIVLYSKLCKSHLEYNLIAQSESFLEIYNMNLTDLLQINQNIIMLIKKGPTQIARIFQKTWFGNEMGQNRVSRAPV